MNYNWTNILLTIVAFILFVLLTACGNGGDNVLLDMGVQYNDPEINQNIIQVLKKENIRHEVTAVGEIRYSRKDSSRVEEISRLIYAKPSACFGNKNNLEQFTSKLKEYGIPFRTKPAANNSIEVSWDHKDDEKAQQIINQLFFADKEPKNK